MEILDRGTCHYCPVREQPHIEKNDSFGQNTIFHLNCRGIWVAILKDEAERPPIGDISQLLHDRFGDAVNDLIQPKNQCGRSGPVVLPTLLEPFLLAHVAHAGAFVEEVHFG